LLDRVAARGNRTQRIEPTTLHLKVLHVLAGPYALFGFRNTSGQLARRGRDIHFARYHVADKAERTAFVAALKYLLERVPLDVDLDALLARWRWWACAWVGSIGILKDWLVDVVAATLVQNGTRLTEEILTKTMPHPARRFSLEMEARAGEHRVAMHDSESAKQFQALVQKPAKAANGKTAQTSGAQPGSPSAAQREQEAMSGATTLPMPQVAPKPTKQRVGQRAPERDPGRDECSGRSSGYWMPFYRSDFGDTCGDWKRREFPSLSVQRAWLSEISPQQRGAR
jgi:hypothetical protein